MKVEFKVFLMHWVLWLFLCMYFNVMAAFGKLLCNGYVILNCIIFFENTLFPFDRPGIYVINIAAEMAPVAKVCKIYHMPFAVTSKGI